MRKTFFILFLVIGISCSEDEPQLPLELSQLETIVPEGWTVGVETESFASGTVVSAKLFPDAVIVFVNLEARYINEDINTERSPNIVLNYYENSRREEIEDVLQNSIWENLCIPYLYDSTSNYLILTTGCLINHGYQSNETEALTVPLENALHDYFSSLR